MPTRLLQENAEVRDKWQNRVRYLLVDEYQDTNTAQYTLVKLLVGVMGQFTAVGDDDQSIYAWRGAKPENMALLKDDFHNLKVIKLEQNYRSTSRILKAANAVIENNPHIFDKKLWSDKGHGETIRVITCLNDDDEAERVVKDLITHKLMNGKIGKITRFCIVVISKHVFLKHNCVRCKFHINCQVVNHSSLALRLKT
jgi:ATP-dependent DNA helicase Rep